jgi:exonuclease III/ribonuclease HI
MMVSSRTMRVMRWGLMVKPARAILHTLLCAKMARRRTRTVFRAGEGELRAAAQQPTGSGGAQGVVSLLTPSPPPNNPASVKEAGGDRLGPNPDGASSFPFMGRCRGGSNASASFNCSQFSPLMSSRPSPTNGWRCSPIQTYSSVPSELSGQNCHTPLWSPPLLKGSGVSTIQRIAINDLDCYAWTSCGRASFCASDTNQGCTTFHLPKLRKMEDKMMYIHELLKSHTSREMLHPYSPKELLAHAPSSHSVAVMEVVAYVGDEGGRESRAEHIPPTAAIPGCTVDRCSVDASEQGSRPVSACHVKQLTAQGPEQETENLSCSPEPLRRSSNNSPSSGKRRRFPFPRRRTRSFSRPKGMKLLPTSASQGEGEVATLSSPPPFPLPLQKIKPVVRLSPSARRARLPAQLPDKHDPRAQHGLCTQHGFLLKHCPISPRRAHLNKTESTRVRPCLTVLNRVQPCPKYVHRGHRGNRTRLVFPTNPCPIPTNRAQPCSTVFNRVQPCSTVFNRVQPCSTVFNRVQPCSTVFNCVPPRPNMTKRSIAYTRGQPSASAHIRHHPIVSLLQDGDIESNPGPPTGTIVDLFQQAQKDLVLVQQTWDTHERAALLALLTEHLERKIKRKSEVEKNSATLAAILRTSPDIKSLWEILSADSHVSAAKDELNRARNKVLEKARTGAHWPSFRPSGWNKEISKSAASIREDRDLIHAPNGDDQLLEGHRDLLDGILQATTENWVLVNKYKREQYESHAPNKSLGDSNVPPPVASDPPPSSRRTNSPLSAAALAAKRRKQRRGALFNGDDMAETLPGKEHLRSMSVQLRGNAGGCCCSKIDRTLSSAHRMRASVIFGSETATLSGTKCSCKGFLKRKWGSYTVWFSGNTKNPNSGGVFIALASNLACRVRNSPLMDEHGRFISIKLQFSNVQSIVLNAVYGKSDPTPGSAEVNGLTDKLNRIRLNASKNGDNTITGGDINVTQKRGYPDRVPEAKNHHADLYENYIGSDADAWITRHGPSKKGLTFRASHESDATKGSRLDVFFVSPNIETAISRVGVWENWEVMGLASDHCPILMDLYLPSIIKTPMKYTRAFDGLKGEPEFPTRFSNVPTPARKGPTPSEPLAKNQIKYHKFIEDENSKLNDPFVAAGYHRNVESAMAAHPEPPHEIEALCPIGSKHNEKDWIEIFHSVFKPLKEAASATFTQRRPPNLKYEHPPLKDKVFYRGRYLRDKLSSLAKLARNPLFTSVEDLQRDPTCARLIRKTNSEPKPGMTLSEWSDSLNTAIKAIQKASRRSERSHRMAKRAEKLKNVVSAFRRGTPTKPSYNEVLRRFHKSNPILTTVVEDELGDKILSSRAIDVHKAALKVWKPIGESTLTEPNKDIFNSIMRNAPSSKKWNIPSVEDLMKQTGFNGENRALDSSLTDSLCLRISDEEWEFVLGTKRQTQAGKSGLSPNLLLETPAEMLNRIRRLIDFCITRGVFPSALGKATITMLHKPGKDLSWENMRPIALCENLGKLISRVVSKRMKRLEEITRDSKNPLFRKSQYAFRSHMGTSDPIQIINGILETAKCDKRSIHLINTDISKAYDSVEWFSLHKNYVRKGMPPAFCSLMRAMDACQVQQINTEFGLTEEYELSRGCRQGEVFSCFRFLFFIDPLIEWMEQVNHLVGFQVGPVQVSSATFADDFTLCSGSNKGIRLLLSMQNAYLAMMGVTISAPKSVYAFRNTTDAPDKSFTMPSIVDPLTKEKSNIKVCKTGDAFRVLGVYFTLDLNWTPQTDMLDEKLNSHLRQLAYSSFPLDIAIKAMNAVVIPTLEFPLQVAAVPRAQLAKWDSKIAAAVKKCGTVARSMNNDILYMPREVGGPGLESIADRASRNLPLTIQCRLSSTNSLSGVVAQTQMEQYRRASALPCSPFFFNTKPSGSMKNFIIPRTHKTLQDLNIQGFGADGSAWIPPTRTYDVALATVLSNDIFARGREALAALEITYLGQVLTREGDRIMSWTEFVSSLTFQQSQNHFAKSKLCPQWYEFIVCDLNEDTKPMNESNRRVKPTLSGLVSKQVTARGTPSSEGNDSLRYLSPYLFDKPQSDYDVDSHWRDHPDAAGTPGEGSTPIELWLDGSAGKNNKGCPDAAFGLLDGVRVTLSPDGRRAEPELGSSEASKLPAGYSPHLLTSSPAEAWAILRGVQTAPHNPVTLYTDSESNIKKWNRIMETGIQPRKSLRKPFHSLWNRIAMTTKARSGKVTIRHTPSHSTCEQGGDPRNDAADRLAVRSMKSDDSHVLDSPVNAFPGSQYGDAPIEFYHHSHDGPPKRIDYDISVAVEEKCLQRRFQRWQSLESQGRGVASNATLPKSKNLSDIAKEDTGVLAKLLTDTLPVMRRLHQRHGAAFTSDRCQLCDLDRTENLNHMTLGCPANSQNTSNMLAEIADWLALGWRSEEGPVSPETAIPNDKLSEALSGIDGAEKFPNKLDRPPLFQRQLARYEGDSTVIAIDTSAFKASLPTLQTTIRESRFWQLHASFLLAKTKDLIAPKDSFIECLIGSLQGYAEGSETIIKETKVTRDRSYWATRQSFLRILAAELNLDTELFCSLVNSFPGFENHYSIIAADEKWGFKLNSLAPTVSWLGVMGYANPEYRKHEVKRMADKCKSTMKKASLPDAPPTRICAILPDGPVLRPDGTFTPGEKWDTEQLVKDTGGTVLAVFPAGSFPFLSSRYFDGKADCGISKERASPNAVVIAVWENNQAKTSHPITDTFVKKVELWARRSPIGPSLPPITTAWSAATAWARRQGMEPESYPKDMHFTFQKACLLPLKGKSWREIKCPCPIGESHLCKAFSPQVVVKHGTIYLECPMSGLVKVSSYSLEVEEYKKHIRSESVHPLVWRNKPTRRYHTMSEIQGSTNWFRTLPYFHLNWLGQRVDLESNRTPLGLSTRAPLSGIRKKFPTGNMEKHPATIPPEIALCITDRGPSHPKKGNKPRQQLGLPEGWSLSKAAPKDPKITSPPLNSYGAKKFSNPFSNENPKSKALSNADRIKWKSARRIFPDVPWNALDVRLRADAEENGGIKLSTVKYEGRSYQETAHLIADHHNHNFFFQAPYHHLLYDNGKSLPPTGWSQSPKYRYGSAPSAIDFIKRAEKIYHQNWFEQIRTESPRRFGADIEVELDATILENGLLPSNEEVKSKVTTFFALMFEECLGKQRASKLTSHCSFASTSTKTSMHILWDGYHFPNYSLETKFANHCWMFLNETADRPDSECSTPLQRAGRELIINPSPPLHKRRTKRFMIDFSVYTRNRAWRMVFNDKLGANRPFIPDSEEEKALGFGPTALNHLRTHIPKGSERLTLSALALPTEYSTCAQPISERQSKWTASIHPDMTHPSPSGKSPSPEPRFSTINEIIEKDRSPLDLAEQAMSDKVCPASRIDCNSLLPIESRIQIALHHASPTGKLVLDHVRGALARGCIRTYRASRERLHKLESLKEAFQSSREHIPPPESPKTKVLWNTREERLAEFARRGQIHLARKQSHTLKTKLRQNKRPHESAIELIQTNLSGDHNDPDAHRCAWEGGVQPASSPLSAAQPVSNTPTPDTLNPVKQTKPQGASSGPRKPKRSRSHSLSSSDISKASDQSKQASALIQGFKRMGAARTIAAKPFPPPAPWPVMKDPFRDSLPPPVFVVMRPSKGCTGQGKFWVFEAGHPDTAVEDVPKLSRKTGRTEAIWQMPLSEGQPLLGARWWAQVGLEHRTSYLKKDISALAPAIRDDEKVNHIPTTETANYPAEYLHYITPESYTLRRINELNPLIDPPTAGNRQTARDIKYAPPLRTAKWEMEITGGALQAALDKPNIIESPIPAGLLPHSLEKAMEFHERLFRICDECNDPKTRSDKAKLVLCDAIDCNKAYCLACLKRKTAPKGRSGFFGPCHKISESAANSHRVFQQFTDKIIVPKGASSHARNQIMARANKPPVVFAKAPKGNPGVHCSNHTAPLSSNSFSESKLTTPVTTNSNPEAPARTNPMPTSAPITATKPNKGKGKYIYTPAELAAQALSKQRDAIPKTVTVKERRLPGPEVSGGPSGYSNHPSASLAAPPWTNRHGANAHITAKAITAKHGPKYDCLASDLGDRRLDDETIIDGLHCIVHQEIPISRKKNVIIRDSFLFSKIAGPNGDTYDPSRTSDLNYVQHKEWIHGKSIVVIPINLALENHWILGVIDFTSSVISILDSLHNEPTEKHVSICQTLANFANRTMAEDYTNMPPIEWQYHTTPVPQQKNGFDCGVFMLMNAWSIALNRPRTYTQEDMGLARINIVIGIDALAGDSNPSGSRLKPQGVRTRRSEAKRKASNDRSYKEPKGDSNLEPTRSGGSSNGSGSHPEPTCAPIAGPNPNGLGTLLPRTYSSLDTGD